MNQKFIDMMFPKEDILYEFANLSSRQTGIENVVIHAYSQGDGKKVKHGPRIKVSNVYGKYSKSDMFVLEVKTGDIVEGTCKLSSKELKTIQRWIKLNKEELIEYWNSEGEMLTDDFFDSLKKVTKEK